MTCRPARGTAGGGENVVAVTGSAGKTTTKDISPTNVWPVGRFPTTKTEGNLTSRSVLPLSLLPALELSRAAVGVIGKSDESRPREVLIIGGHPPAQCGRGDECGLRAHRESLDSIEASRPAKRDLIEALPADRNRGGPHARRRPGLRRVSPGAPPGRTGACLRAIARRPERPGPKTSKYSLRRRTPASASVNYIFFSITRSQRRHSVSKHPGRHRGCRPGTLRASPPDACQEPFSNFFPRKNAR